MAKINKHIEIVSSSTGPLSSMSKKSYTMIHTALSKYYTHVGVTLVNTEADLEILAQKDPDLVFLGSKRVPKTVSRDGETEYIWLSEFLESKNIPYTGSPTEAHKLEQHKDRAKDAVKGAGLDTSEYFMASKDEFTNASQLTLGFPLFIKPPRLGGGLGIGPDSVVRDFDDFTKKVASLSDNLHSNAMVEDYLTGREFTVAVLRSVDGSHLQTLPIEMLPHQNDLGDRVIGHEMKNAKAETPVAAVEDSAIKDSVMNLARDVFIALGARDYGRIDIRLDKNGRPCFLEANLIPSIINGSGNFQKACLINIGLDYEQMLLHIIDLALMRSEDTQDNQVRDEITGPVAIMSC